MKQIDDITNQMDALQRSLNSIQHVLKGEPRGHLTTFEEEMVYLREYLNGAGLHLFALESQRCHDAEAQKPSVIQVDSAQFLKDAHEAH